MVPELNYALFIYGVKIVQILPQPALRYDWPLFLMRLVLFVQQYHH